MFEWITVAVFGRITFFVRVFAFFWYVPTFLVCAYFFFCVYPLVDMTVLAATQRACSNSRTTPFSDVNMYKKYECGHYPCARALLHLCDFVYQSDNRTVH